MRSWAARWLDVVKDLSQSGWLHTNVLGGCAELDAALDAACGVALSVTTFLFLGREAWPESVHGCSYPGCKPSRRQSSWSSSSETSVTIIAVDVLALRGCLGSSPAATSALAAPPRSRCTTSMRGATTMASAVPTISMRDRFRGRPSPMHSAVSPCRSSGLSRRPTRSSHGAPVREDIE